MLTSIFKNALDFNIGTEHRNILNNPFEYSCFVLQLYLAVCNG